MNHNTYDFVLEDHPTWTKEEFLSQIGDDISLSSRQQRHPGNNTRQRRALVQEEPQQQQQRRTRRHLVVYDGLVINLDGFRHPGGQHIIHRPNETNGNRNSKEELHSSLIGTDVTFEVQRAHAFNRKVLSALRPRTIARLDDKYALLNHEERSLRNLSELFMANGYHYVFKSFRCTFQEFLQPLAFIMFGHIFMYLLCFVCDTSNLDNGGTLPTHRPLLVVFLVGLILSTIGYTKLLWWLYECKQHMRFSGSISRHHKKAAELLLELFSLLCYGVIVKMISDQRLTRMSSLSSNYHHGAGMFLVCPSSVLSVFLTSSGGTYGVPRHGNPLSLQGGLSLLWKRILQGVIIFRFWLFWWMGWKGFIPVFIALVIVHLVLYLNYHKGILLPTFGQDNIHQKYSFSSSSSPSSSLPTATTSTRCRSYSYRLCKWIMKYLDCYPTERQLFPHVPSSQLPSVRHHLQSLCSTNSLE